MADRNGSIWTLRPDHITHRMTGWNRDTCCRLGDCLCERRKTGRSGAVTLSRMPNFRMCQSGQLRTFRLLKRVFLQPGRD